MDRRKAASVVRYLGMGIMIVFSLTQLIPSLELAGNAVWVGLASFFVVEALCGRSEESGLRFATMGGELKDRSVWILIGVLSGLQILWVCAGRRIFGQAFIDYDLGRALDVMHSDSVLFLLAMVPLSAWGEEIAWRGFFLGKKPARFSTLLWSVITSCLFAMGHISQHPLPLVLFGITSNFLCSLLLCRIYLKTRNCMISTLAHIIGNIAEILWILLFFWQ